MTTVTVALKALVALQGLAKITQAFPTKSRATLSPARCKGGLLLSDTLKSSPDRLPVGRVPSQVHLLARQVDLSCILPDHFRCIAPEVPKGSENPEKYRAGYWMSSTDLNLPASHLTS